MQNIDESLYSRQLYAIGKDTTHKLINSKIFVYGIRGPIIETLKNLILCGIGEITLYEDPSLSYVSQLDIELNYNYYLKQNDLNKPILDIMGKRLNELNPNVKINKYTKELKKDIMKKYNLVLFSGNINDETILDLTDYLHVNNIYYIVTNTFGVFGNIFCDFGENFISYDTNGEKLLSGLILESKYNIYKCQKPHELSKDMEICLKNKTFVQKGKIIKIIDRFSFESDINGVFDSFEEIKTSEKFSFKSLRDSLDQPEFVLTDFKDFELSQNLHNLLLNKDNLISFSEKIKLNLNKIIKEQLQLIPVNSVIGGLTSHLIICGVTNKYTPAKQFLYYGCLDLIETILDLTKINFNDNIFIVGAVALGCEHLKNLASYGFNIRITDMDTIEKSNLNRQFLFRNSDIGKPKSIQATYAIKKMFPKAKVFGELNKVCEETSDIYNEKFYCDKSAVINALDNIPARIYVDSECIKYGSPLFESGTLGTKGNVQVILPNLTESYGSTADPSEESIPVCTLKNHPYLIEHCIQWSKELFQNFFVEPFNILKKLNKTILDKFNLDKFNLDKFNDNEINEMYDNLELFTKFYGNTDRYILNKFNELFNINILNLLESNPLDKVDEDGKIYWSGTKKVPVPIKYNYIDDDTKLFIDSYINIISRVFKENISIESTRSEDLDIHAKKERIKIIMESLQTYNFNIEEFEKDDDMNSHIDFIMASSNLRAINYQITPVTRFEVKGIAGKIIPALSTTTSIISGLVCIEYLKYIKYKKLDTIQIEKFNNYYISLGIQFFGNSDPIECKTKKIGKLDFNLWTILKLKCKNINEIVHYFEENNIEVSCINMNKNMIYSNFTTCVFNPEDKIDIGTTLDILCQEISDEHQKEVNLDDELIQIKLI